MVQPFFPSGVKSPGHEPDRQFKDSRYNMTIFTPLNSRWCNCCETISKPPAANNCPEPQIRTMPDRVSPVARSIPHFPPFSTDVARERCPAKPKLAENSSQVSVNLPSLALLSGWLR